MTSTNKTSPSSPQDEHEARRYYYGLPSRPVLVCRTGTPWEIPTGPEAYSVPKEAKPVFDHPIADVWDELGPHIPDYLDSLSVMWTTVDVVCFTALEKKVDPWTGPPVLWIGVIPWSLSRQHAEVAVGGCEGLLSKFGLTDVEVAFRESLFTRSAGPQLLEYADPLFNETADVCGPLTPALGLQIAAKATPYIEGTGALYIRESSDSNRVFVLTARHVVLPPSAGPNELYVRKNVSQPRHDVLLLGSKAFQDLLKSITAWIQRHTCIIDIYTGWLKGSPSDGGDDVQKERIPRLEGLVRKSEEAIDVLNKFHSEVTKYWNAESQRILGHIAYSPPISVSAGTKRFTEDWALIELDAEKIDWKCFRGNAIDLGTTVSDHDFMLKMCPEPHTPASFKYPLDHLLPLQGILTYDELRRPTVSGADGKPWPFVIKNGTGTGMTMGRASGMLSFVREYFPDGNHQTSMELAIYPYGHKDEDRIFSGPGDSGAIIAGPTGRIVGLLSGRSGQTADAPDVTYATPFCWLWDECIKRRFPDARLY